MKQPTDREPFAIGPSTRVVIPDADPSLFFMGLGFGVAIAAVLAVAAVDCMRFEYPLLAAICGIAALAALAHQVHRLRDYREKLGKGFVFTYLGLERYEGGKTIASLQWHEVRLVQLRPKGPLHLDLWALGAYALESSQPLGLIEMANVRHARMLTSFMMLRCGKLETDPNYYASPQAKRLGGLRNFGIGVLFSALALPIAGVLFLQSEKGSISNAIAATLAILSFFAVSIAALGLLDVARSFGRNGLEREMTEMQERVFRRVPLRVEMEPDLCYVYRDREKVYRRERAEYSKMAAVMLAAGLICIPLALLMPPQGASSRSLIDVVSVFCIFGGLALLTLLLGLAASSRVLHRFKIEGDAFLVDSGKRIRRFPIRPIFRWKGGLRQDKWMSVTDRYWRFPILYPVDPCFLVEEECVEARRAGSSDPRA